MKGRKAPLRVWSDSSVYQNGQIGEQEAYYAVVVDDGTVDGMLVEEEFIGDMSVNDGEYLGVLAALRFISDADFDHTAVVITDSQLVFGHCILGWRCNLPTLRLLRDRVRHMLEITDADLVWKRRHKNKAGLHFERVVTARRKEKYKDKKDQKRSKRKVVRAITLMSRELGEDDLHIVVDKMG